MAIKEGRPKSAAEVRQETAKIRRERRLGRRQTEVNPTVDCPNCGGAGCEKCNNTGAVLDISER